MIDEWWFIYIIWWPWSGGVCLFDSWGGMWESKYTYILIIDAPELFLHLSSLDFIR